MYVAIHTYTNFVQATIAYCDIQLCLLHVLYIPFYTPKACISNLYTFHVFITSCYVRMSPMCCTNRLWWPIGKRFASVLIAVLVGVGDRQFIAKVCATRRMPFPHCTLFQMLTPLQHSLGGFSMCGLNQFNSAHSVNIHGTSVSTAIPHTLWHVW